MFSHQFRRLSEQLRSSVESLRSELSEIKESANKQERAIRDTSQAADEKRGVIPRIIASAIEAANQDVPTYEKTQRNEEYRLQRKFPCPAWISLRAASERRSAVAAIARRHLGTT